MNIDLVATGGGRYRVMRDGVEVSAHTQQHTATVAGIKAKQATPAALVEIVTDFRVRVEIKLASVPVEPTPVDPVPVEPAPADPVEPDPEPEPPVIVPPYSGDSLLMEQASTMQPGEWRNIAHLTTWPGKESGGSFKNFQHVFTPEGAYIADGMGWTQCLVHHEGALMCVIGRDSSHAVLLHMDKYGVFRRHESVWKSTVGRRPFNRLTQDDTHLYFAPNDAREVMGYFRRTSLADPGVFERIGPSFGDSQMDTVGNFAVTYVPEWGRFYAYTPGGKVWSRAPSDAAWHLNGRFPIDTDGRLSGYAGLLLWNPIKKELAIVGGQVFGTTTDTSHHVYRLTAPMGVPERLANRVGPNGSPMYWSSSQSRMFVNPNNGDYLLMNENLIYTNDSAGGQFALYEDVRTTKPFGNWETYAPGTLIPGTDVFAFISHIRGLVLHRVRATDTNGKTPPTDTEVPSDPIDDKTPADPAPDLLPAPPPVSYPSGSLAGSKLAADAERIVPGTWASGLGAASFNGVWTRNTLNNNSSDFWAPVAVWNPAQARMYGVLDRTANGNTVESVVLPYYDAASDAWGNAPVPQLNGKFGSPHVYGRWAIDIRRQKMYRRTQGDVWELDLLSHVWTNTGPRNSAWGEGIAMHEGTGELMYMNSSGRVMAWNPDNNFVREIGINPAATDRHSHGHYNATRNEVCFSFGDGGDVMTLVSASGIVRAVQVPAEVREGQKTSCIFTFYDPVSGHYLVYHTDTRCGSLTQTLIDGRRL
jgi:hypothetical protein